MIDSVTLINPVNGSLFLDPATYPLHNISIDVGSRRDETSRVQEHGQYKSRDYLDSMLINIDGDILGSNYNDLIQKRIALKSMLVPYPELGYEYTTRIEMQPAGLPEVVWAECNIDGLPEIPIEAAVPSSSSFSLGFVCPTPTLFGKTLNSQHTGSPGQSGGLSLPITLPFSLGTIAAGGRISLTMSGKVSTWPIVTFYGPCQDPRIILRRDNIDYVFGLEDIVLNFGDYVVCDFLNSTIVNQTGGNFRSKLSAESVRWKLYPLTNDVRFVADNTTSDADAVVSWYNAYQL